MDRMGVIQFVDGLIESKGSNNHFDLVFLMLGLGFSSLAMVDAAIFIAPCLSCYNIRGFPVDSRA